MGWCLGRWVGWGSHRCFATAWSVTGGRGRGRNPRPCRSPTLLAAAAADPVPAAGSPKRAWRSQSSLKRVLRNTGLLSHSAAPLLQLAPLRRPGSRLPIDRQRSPPVVSTAFLVPGTRFSVTRYPRIARLDNVHLESRTALAHCQTPARPTVAPLLVHPGARESRAPLSTRIREPAGVPSLRMCRCPSELVRAHSQGGAPPGVASRRCAPQRPSRPPRRPEVAEPARGR
jgi:hypothetical protein